MNRQIANQTHQQKPTTTPAASGLLQRKCACGNHTMAGGECAACGKTKRLGLQAKLKVNEPGDIYEQEADRIADQVMSTPVRSTVSSALLRIQRFAGQSTGQAEGAPASVDQALASPGRPLEPALRQDMEQRFGYDFSRVRVHTDATSEQSVRDVNALAYTVGSHVVIASDRYAPHSAGGRALLAHELTHVVQQSGTGARAVQMKRGGDSEGGKPKRKTILVIHARAGSKEGASALISGEAKPISIELTYNVLTEGDYTLVKRDIPETELVEYVNEDGGAAGIAWRKPTKDFHGAERVRVKVQPQEFDFAEFAQAEFDAVDPQIKNRLSKRGGQRLRTPEEQLGFAFFAKELEARGVTDEELILYQTRHRGGVNPRHRFDWANNWKDAVDEVLGSRGRLEKAATQNTENFAAFGVTFTGLSDEAYKLYKMSRLLPGLTGLTEATEGQLAEAGTSLDEFEANRDFLLEMFDERLRLETFAALDKFEGGLLLTKERLVDSKEGRQQIDLARQAANRDDVKLLKSRSETAARDSDAAKTAWIAAVHEFYFSSTNLFELTTIHDRPSSADAMKSAEETLRAKEAVAEEARQAYLSALQSATGVPVASWRGFDVDQFFFGASADRSANILARYIARKLSAVERARKELQKDTRTIYKADMMVALTKERLNVQRGSLVEKLVADRVEEYKSAPWWEQLLDILSLALIFVPGAGVLRVAASAASVIVTANNESQSELLFDAHVQSTGGSLGSVALSGIGLVGDVGDIVKAARALGGVGKVFPSAEQAPKVVSETTEAAAATAKAEPSVVAKAATPEPVPAPATAPGSVAEEVPPPKGASSEPAPAPAVAKGDVAPVPPKGPKPAADVTPSAPAPEARVAPSAAEDVAVTPTRVAKPARPQVDIAQRDAARAHLDKIRAKKPERGSFGEGWDYDRFPAGPRRKWKPGDPPDMPSPRGVHPTWATVRARVWKNLAHNELTLRRAGEAVRDTSRLLDLEAVKSLTDRQLKTILKTGKRRAGFELEHARIPQRAARLFEKAGLPRHEARRLAHLGDPGNLDPVVEAWHAVVDEAAALWKSRNPTLPQSIDDRLDFMLGSMKPSEIEDLLGAIARNNIDLGSTEAGLKLRELLEAAKDRWGATAANWAIP